MRRIAYLVWIALVFSSIGVAFGSVPETLLIGPGDVVHVQILDTPELDQHPRVTDAGEIPLMGVGSLKIAGLTPAEAAESVRVHLIASHYMNHPVVSVVIEQYATQTVSVLGQVKSPGAYPIGTPRSVLSVVALAGGLTESADYNITIERRNNPQQPVSYTLSNDARAAIAGEVQIFPGDTIIVPKAGITYVLGAVGRPGGFVMQNNHSELTALQAVSLAAGTLPSAVPSHARLIRKEPQGGYQEIPIDFSAIQKGKEPDVLLRADDTLYIPFSYLRNMASNSSGIAASIAGAAIYAVP